MEEPVELVVNQPLILAETLACGQGHRWLSRDDGWYETVTGSELIRIRQSQDGIEFVGAADAADLKQWLHRHFRLNDDIEAIHAELSQRDNVMASLIERHLGLRVIRVDPWECLVFFILSANNNIPRTQRDMERIAVTFGAPVDSCRSTFPGPEVISQESVLMELEGLGLGLNKGLKVHQAAQAVHMGRLDLNALVGEPDHQMVTNELRTLYGVGDKVANCVALFALEQLDAFPVDTHVSGAIKRHYREAPRSAEALRKWGQRRFGRYAGYAEGILFFDDLARGSW